jgi:ATP-dependent Lhr-like helicase
MTSLPPSASDPLSSFDRLHVEIRRWIREQGWQELREVQDRTIRAVLDGEGDVLVAAGTSAGKTEAAFLPVLTHVAGREEAGLSVLYVSPLKALINDQHRRLELLCERLEIDLVRWHGDAPHAAKARTRRNPRGVVLITPESIEALFLRRTEDARALFGTLDFVVIDELHAFMQGPRGLHLASLLRRIDAIAGKRARRIGLSATIGDLDIAKAWLRPAGPGAVHVVETKGRPAISLQIRGYVEPPGADGRDDLERETAEGGEEAPDALDRIADHLFAKLRGENNLVFGGSRRTVEALADRLRRRSEFAPVPNEFFPHHGSLAKELREELELRLKAGALPTTAVATTTLELGIDIGSVKSVAVVGAPRSLASLKQRLGRSGRRGTPAVLRIYVRERYLEPDADPLHRLRLDTVRAVAAVRLLVENFVEPSVEDASLLSVLVHQILSTIVERGGARAEALHTALCSEGPFSAISVRDFAILLRAMAGPEARLIEQAPDGLIMLGTGGEALEKRRDFYAVFQTDEEWRLIAGGRSLGTIPIANAVVVGGLIAFAGRRWRITAVDERAKVLEVEPHRSAKLPLFDRLASEPMHDRITEEMAAVYRAEDVPSYLDEAALGLLLEGRAAFHDLRLTSARLLESKREVHAFTWRGSATNDALAILLRSSGLEVETHDVGVTIVEATKERVVSELKRLARPVDAHELAASVANLRSAKFDEYVPDELLRRAWARRSSEVCARLPEVCISLLEA